MTTKTGVVVMAYGTPGSAEEIEPYYTKIRHGHPPTPELLADLVRRYEAIGGISPLSELTAAQVAGITRTLEAKHPDTYTVAFGAKYTAPSVEDGVVALDGCTRIIGIVLTPHQASLGSEQYHDRARAEAERRGATYVPVTHFYDLESFAAIQANRLNAALAKLPASANGSTMVAFTAHSLPEKILELGDPYPSQVAESGAMIAEAAGVTDFLIAWQSAGRTRDPWIGPSILEILPALQHEGTTHLVVCPVGFVADHLEVLYDLDIEADKAANELGLHLSRTTSLNADQDFLDVLVEAIVRADTTSD